MPSDMAVRACLWKMFFRIRGRIDEVIDSSPDYPYTNIKATQGGKGIYAFNTNADCIRIEPMQSSLSSAINQLNRKGDEVK